MKQINKNRIIGSGLFIWIIAIALVVISGKLPATSIIKKSEDIISHNEEYVILSTEGPVEILSAQIYQHTLPSRYVVVTYKESGGTVYTEIHKLKVLMEYKTKVDGFKIRYVEQGNLDK